MRIGLCIVLLAVLSGGEVSGQAASVVAPQPMTSAEAAQVDATVRSMMATIAHEVTHDGPLAWRKHFADSPAFFMVNDGQMAFPHSADATKGIQGFAATIKSIRLEWGSDLRIDPLTQDFAVVATSYFEEQEPLKGNPVQVRGYFTGVAELRDGRWQLRDAHWSSLHPQ